MYKLPLGGAYVPTQEKKKKTLDTYRWGALVPAQEKKKL